MSHAPSVIRFIAVVFMLVAVWLVAVVRIVGIGDVPRDLRQLGLGLGYQCGRGVDDHDHDSSKRED